MKKINPSAVPPKKNKKSYFFRSMALTLALTLGTTLAAQDRIGDPDIDPPDFPGDDATIIDEEQAAQLLQQEDVLISDPAAESEASAKSLEEDQRLVREFLKSNPKVAQRFSFEEPNDEGITPTGDGNFSYFRRDNSGQEQQIVTLGSHFGFHSLAASLRRFREADNQSETYRMLYRLGQILKAPGLEIGKFPSLRRIKRFNAQQINVLNNRIARRLFEIRDFPFKVLELGPPECDEEAGYDEGRDRSGSSCGYSATGVFQNHEWPLKKYLTCVKNQANRGTCVSFAINAGLETAVAKKYKKWTNLAEQDLYYRGAGVWHPRAFGDGLWTAGMLDNLVTRGYKVPYEEQWDYNPSNSRQSLPVGAATYYANSCVNYNGSEAPYCSDTAHQGQKFCFPGILSWLCFALPAPATAPAPYKLQTAVQLWDVANPDLSFVKLILTLALGQKPVVLDIPVYTSWDQADTNGYVRGGGLPLCPPDQDGVCRVKSGCECNRGWHAVTAVGFIDNSKLPSGAPTGAGGGYVIIKNSWGTCFGDGGYVYVPYSWIKNLVGSAVAITQVMN